jgi:hypothetical protein
MPIPMPTIVSKGILAHKLDRRYSTPERRLASLRKLQNALDNYIPPGTTGAAARTGVAVGATGTRAISAGDATHLGSHWFGPKFDPATAGHPTQLPTDPNNIWSVITPPASGSSWASIGPMSDEAASDGEYIITAGLVEALKISLGLHDSPNWRTNPGGPRFRPVPAPLNVEGKVTTPLTVKEIQEVDADSDIPSTTPGKERMLDVASLKRNLPIDIYWVCGKFDGFEVQISWNPRQVTVFLLTPPVSFPVGALAAYLGNELDEASDHAQSGMILVRGATDANGRVYGRTVDLVGMTDGGVTPGPA